MEIKASTMANRINEQINSWKQLEETEQFVSAVPNGFVKNELINSCHNIRTKLQFIQKQVIMDSFQHFVYFSYTMHDLVFDNIMDEISYLVHCYFLFNGWTYNSDTHQQFICPDFPQEWKDNQLYMAQYTKDKEVIHMHIFDEDDTVLLQVSRDQDKDEKEYPLLIEDYIDSSQADRYKRLNHIQELYDYLNDNLEIFSTQTQHTHDIKSNKSLSSSSFAPSIPLSSSSPLPSFAPSVPLSSSSPLPSFAPSVPLSAFTPPSQQRPLAKAPNPFDSDRLPAGINGPSGSLFGPNMFKPPTEPIDHFPPGSRFDPYGPAKHPPIWPQGIARPHTNPKNKPQPFGSLNPDNLKPQEDYDYTYM
ncbi:hypothetical protein WA158_002041 [Blastocystis sp. Blastoise]